MVFIERKMPLEFENKVAYFLNKSDFPFSKVKILLAVSGGADSMALLYVFHSLKAHEVFSGELHCVHINHQLRTDADSDEEFVTSQAHKLKIPVTTRRIDVRKYSEMNKLSIETAARRLRIKNLMETARASNCRWIATGHQKNDNAETVVHRLLRGTGFRGLAGIWPVRKFDVNISFVRPLLCVTRDEIIQYLQKNNLIWHEDYTNTDCIFTRNYIRHRLLPALEKGCKDSLTDQLFNLSLSANKFHRNVCGQADSLWPKVAQLYDEKVTLKLEAFLTQMPPIQLELIRRSLARIGCGEAALTSQHYERILHISKQNISRKTLQISGGFLIQREHQNVVFYRADSSLRRFNEAESETIKIPGQTTFDRFSIQASVLERQEVDIEKFKKSKTSSIEWFDFDKIKPPLTIRFRKDGDRFVPLGQKGEKKIGKFISDQKVPGEIRNRILIISDSEKVIWLHPIRISEQTKITPQTRTILQLVINRTID
jgi:tRNA(Ile)-lysidine synthase